jgi:hypothetical protein
VPNRVYIEQHDALFAARAGADWDRIVAFRNQPHFLDGARRHEGVMAAFFSNNLILNKVVLEAWRFQMIVFTLYLHATRDPADPRTGLTYGNLARISKQLDLASSGRVYAFLSLMKVGNYIKSERSLTDSRVVHLVPTPHFMAIVEKWNDGIFAAIDAAVGTDRVARARTQFPELGLSMRTSGADGLLAGWKPLDPFPEVAHFANVDGGWMLMEQAVAASLRDPAGLIVAPVAINLRTLGKDFGGSRSNLRRLLESAYDLGLLDAHPKGGAHILLSSRMLCAFLTFIASYLGYFAQHTEIALSKYAAQV